MVSIVILSHERFSDLRRTLDSINKLAGVECEVIVIDNNSNDKRIKKLEREFEEVKFIFLSKNLGTSLTRNAGVAISKGQYIWFLDDDVEITNPDYLKHALKAFEDNPEVGAIGGEASLDENDNIIGTKKLNLDLTGFTNGEIDTSEYGKLSEVQCLATCNLLVKRDVLNEVGGFDPWFFFYLEDLDLTYRIYLNGFKLLSFGQVPVIHWTSSTGRKTVFVSPRKNRVYFILKNFNFYRLLVMPLLDLIYIFNPKNIRRTLNFSRKSDLNAAAFYRGGGANRKLTVKKLFRGITKGAMFVISIYLGYIIAMPSIFDALKKRRNKKNYINSESIENYLIKEKYAEASD